MADTYTTPQGVFQGQPPIDFPKTPGYQPAQPCPVGGVVLAEGDLEYNTDRRTVTLKVRNCGDRPIQVGSHFHFFEVNRYLEFDRDAAFGMHLNIPATTAIRFEPGEEKEVELVDFAGKRRIIGFNGLVQGYAGYDGQSHILSPQDARFPQNGGIRLQEYFRRRGRRRIHHAGTQTVNPSKVITYGNHIKTRKQQPVRPDRRRSYPTGQHIALRPD